MVLALDDLVLLFLGIEPKPNSGTEIYMKDL